ncbi:MAG: DUF790 family protein [Planctomycetota bacterium]|nr:MAG: DUF790 family protein [Planctomycetota bacterium]
MLTADLLLADVRKGEVQPRYLPLEGEVAEEHLARAAELIALFADHEGRRRGELDDALAERTRGRPDFKVDRGLAKLLEDATEFRGLDAGEAAGLRREVFVAAARARREGDFDREAILQGVGEARGWSAGQVEAQLYADLKANELVVSVPRLRPRELLERYNLGLAQAVLLRALALRVAVHDAPPPRLRQLFRNVKFHGLLTRAERKGTTVHLELDGPLSLFGNTARYGVRMAGFLPALLLCPRWELDADVRLGKSRRSRRFRLSPEVGLVGRRRDAGAWLPDMVGAFTARFAELAPDWSVDEQVPVLNLGGEVVVPDLRFVHPESGWEGWLEFLGYWRRGGVARRLQALAQHGAPRLVLALDRGLRLDEETLRGLEGPVVPYREMPSARKVLRALEALRDASPPRPCEGRKASPRRPKRNRSPARRGGKRGRPRRRGPQT